ncbi:MAG TPA: NUDIX domain-containing protein [Candidatus Saccharibacteria bacterium]|jgi:8-oxo-dGTP pyrophosphatase MutT (NUDIX family)|nr:NUDIX domain-containing protein [Candidatus Saccharibacteria bacterium]HMR38019.1 NUDIX domain-containing protein [Candidatus Saccharibacteria bacterium]
MKHIISLDQHALGFYEEDDRPIDRTRRAARAVLRNESGQIALMRFSTTGSYKLPGGGIDEGESVEAALAREIREETGYTISSMQPLGIIEEDRYFCGMHQTSYCFSALTDAFVGTELTDKELARGMELAWFGSIDQAIAAVQRSSIADEDGSIAGLEMMKLREVAILNSALMQESGKE